MIKCIDITTDAGEPVDFEVVPVRPVYEFDHMNSRFEPAWTFATAEKDAIKRRENDINNLL